jgi:hypothetical protein
MLDGEPLEVHDVRGARGAPVAEHVGDVLGELNHATQAGARREAGGAVEELASLIAFGRGDGAIGEAARVELDLGPRRRQRVAEGMVIGRRVGRGVDDVDAEVRGNRQAER